MSRGVALALTAALCIANASSPALATSGWGYGGYGGMTVEGPECVFSGPAQDLLPDSIRYVVKNKGKSHIYVTVSGTNGIQPSPTSLSIAPNKEKVVVVSAKVERRRRPGVYRGSLIFSGPTCSDVKKWCTITVTDPTPVSP